MKKTLLALALTLSALGFAPSGFCAPKAKPNKPISSKTGKEKKPKTTKPSENRYKKIIISSDILCKISLPRDRNDNYVFAPNAQVLDSYTFVHNPNIEVVELPKIKYIYRNAFSECKNLKKVILGNDLKEIFPSSFSKSNPDLKLVYQGKEYSPLEFFKKMDPAVVLKSPEETSREKIKNITSINKQALEKVVPRFRTIPVIPLRRPLASARFSPFLLNSTPGKTKFRPIVSHNIVFNPYKFSKSASSSREPSIIEDSLDE